MGTDYRKIAADIGTKYEEKYRADGSERSDLQAALGTLADRILEALEGYYSQHKRFGALLMGNRVEMDIGLRDRSKWSAEESAEFESLQNALRYAESKFAEEAFPEKPTRKARKAR
jgi:hypothetical protein